MKNMPVKWRGNFKNFCRIALENFDEIQKILIKFSELGVYIKFIGKLCKFFVQLVDQGNFEELKKKIVRKLLCKFLENF